MFISYEGPSIDGFSSGCLYCPKASTDCADIEFFDISKNLTSTVTMRAKNHAVSLRIQPFRWDLLLHFPLPRHHRKDIRFNSPRSRSYGFDSRLCEACGRNSSCTSHRLNPSSTASRTLPFKVTLAVCQLPDECHLQRDARLLLPVRLVGVFKESHQPSDGKSPAHPTINFVI